MKQSAPSYGLAVRVNIVLQDRPNIRTTKLNRKEKLSVPPDTAVTQPIYREPVRSEDEKHYRYGRACWCTLPTASPSLTGKNLNPSSAPRVAALRSILEREKHNNIPRCRSFVQVRRCCPRPTADIQRPAKKFQRYPRRLLLSTTYGRFYFPKKYPNAAPGAWERKQNSLTPAYRKNKQKNCLTPFPALWGASSKSGRPPFGVDPQPTCPRVAILLRP